MLAAIAMLWSCNLLSPVLDCVTKMPDQTGLTTMPPQSVAMYFQLGERRLATARRKLLLQRFDLDAALSDREWAMPTLPVAADGLMLNSLPATKLEAVKQAAGNMLVHVKQVFPRYYASLEGSYEGYLQGFSAKTRSTLKRKMRKFEELSGGTIDMRIYRTPAELAQFHAMARAVSEKTYQERLLDSGLPQSQGFLDAMREQAAADRARGYLLFLDGEPVSYLYTPIEDGRVIYAYLGYDPALSLHSPGTVLQLMAMEVLFGEARYRFFDFTEGDGQHKRLFSTGHVTCADVLLLRRTLGNILLLGALQGFDRIVDKLGALAERHGVKSRLKKWLRRG